MLKNTAKRLVKMLNPPSLSVIRKFDKQKIIILHKEIPLIRAEIQDLRSTLTAHSTSSKHNIENRYYFSFHEIKTLFN